MDTIVRYLHVCIDVLFPPRPHELLVRQCRGEPSAQPRTHLYITALLSYRQPIIEALIQEAKFHHNRTAIKLLGEVLHTALGTRNDALIVPIPLSARRLRERGHNQVTSIIAAAGYTATPLLTRTKHTTPQMLLSRSERLHNLSGAFAINTRAADAISKDTPLLIIDDVTTTGATLKEAQKTLEAAGFTRVQMLALAR